MDEYLTEIEFAVSGLVPAVWGERSRLRNLEAEVAALDRVVEDNYRRAEFVAMNAGDADEVAMAAGMQWENYFGVDKHRHHKDQVRSRLAARVATHAFSVGALAGALLQFARQGVSLVHGGFADCPGGGRSAASP